jgi:hypothetical protein
MFWCACRPAVRKFLGHDDAATVMDVHVALFLETVNIFYTTPSAPEELISAPVTVVKFLFFHPIPLFETPYLGNSSLKLLCSSDMVISSSFKEVLTKWKAAKCVENS